MFVDDARGVRAAPTILFEGSPSLASTMPYLAVTLIAAAIVLVAATLASTAGLAMAWGLAEAAVLLLALSFSYKVAHVISCWIEIDDARIRVRSGVILREVASLELFRIQNVWAIAHGWQRIAGIGDLVIETSDPRHPVWCLSGLPNPEALRDALNVASVELRTRRGIGEVNLGAI
ncbi:hypothetical protein WK76_25040 [Burkholderia ubonensis]|uniref:PH domain-containing protein n=1 Tax=Burkholderia ubonensis TaxID=101571 RepID=UPI00075C73BE|nr:PH domain-containing protein [Burkholderia ubonensis]KVU84290.1 hypothetical protein WK76_25040 [Burkholderia ubonensis]